MIELVKIPSGSFMMGSPEGEGYSDEHPQHEVTIKEFYMSKYPVTQEQYRAIMGENPSYFKDGDQLPVEQVSWDDAREFCQKLSEQTGKEYRLPTEAEWEYACRAGTTTKYYFGDDITEQQANYGSYIRKTTIVGKYPPNDFGLYDMHGNVWEWCEDDWHDDYEGAPTDGSAWVPERNDRKVARGGSWDDYPAYGRSAFRNNPSRDTRNGRLGFRIASSVNDESEEGNRKVTRGGSWGIFPNGCRSAYRNDDTRDTRNYYTGFRVASSVDKEPERDNRKVVRGGSWDDNPNFCRSASRYNYARGDRYYFLGFRVACDIPTTT